MKKIRLIFNQNKLPSLGETQQSLTSPNASAVGFQDSWPSLGPQLLCPQIKPDLQSASESQSPSPSLHGILGVQQFSSPLHSTNCQKNVNKNYFSMRFILRKILVYLNPLSYQQTNILIAKKLPNTLVSI